MIIQLTDASLLLVTQPDHAALSAHIMRRWRDRGFATHPRRESILLAVQEHDNGWQEVDAAPIVDTSSGRLMDFMNAPAALKRAIWPRGVGRLSHDPWAAALVAQHALHVYRHYRGAVEWDAFFAELESTRDGHLRRAIGRTLHDLVTDYFFVRMGDLLSLTFCNGWQEAPEQQDYAIRLEESRLIIRPDPFAGEVVPFFVRARELPNAPFQSQVDAVRVFDAAPSRQLQGVAAGA
ncbi:MAG TPA: DUF3891 family protein [Vicinamibacterales bacterium]|nr:DUF3891 family protein [Vicinamibacterales bacterium]